MKPKIFLITTLLFLQVHFLFSQCISIELSVTWEMGHDIFIKDSVMSIPILNITYRNNCDTNYYFFKVSPRSDDYPMVLCWGSIHPDESIDYLKKGEFRGEYVNQNFNVLMGWQPSYEAGWLIFNDTINYPHQFSMENIHCILHLIYAYIYSGKNRDYKTPAYFVSSDITPENILLDLFVKDQFVYIKSGETHIDTYNLMGYKMVEGCFTFLITKNAIERYVITSFGLDEEKFELPTIVGEYHRYSGVFNTNKVTVCFGER